MLKTNHGPGALVAAALLTGFWRGSAHHAQRRPGRRGPVRSFRIATRSRRQARAGSMPAYCRVEAGRAPDPVALTSPAGRSCYVGRPARERLGWGRPEPPPSRLPGLGGPGASPC
jgi:hypothetical protein